MSKSDAGDTGKQRSISYSRVRSVGPHLYRAVYVPAGCATYVVDSTYTLHVEEPPEPYLVLEQAGPCTGTFFLCEE